MILALKTTFLYFVWEYVVISHKDLIKLKTLFYEGYC